MTTSRRGRTNQYALSTILKQMKDEVAGKQPKPKKVKSSDLSMEPDDSILKWMVTTVTTRDAEDSSPTVEKKVEKMVEEIREVWEERAKMKPIFFKDLPF